MLPSPEEMDLKPWETCLVVDALYFHAARQALERAKGATKGIEKAERRWKALEAKEARILDKHGGDSYAAGDELESIYIQMDGAEYALGEAHAPLLKETAVVHMLCAASLEAHVNAIAGESLSAKEKGIFERLALDAKWLLLPRVLGCSVFEADRQPFQRFAKLVKLRNRLVHYKGVKEEWTMGTVPSFISKLGLTLRDAEDSIKAVDGMMRALAKKRGVEPPTWLRPDLNQMDYFKITK